MANRIDSGSIHVFALAKGAERYVILTDSAGRNDALRTLGRWASDPEMRFTWYDAAVIAQKIRAMIPLNEGG